MPNYSIEFLSLYFVSDTFWLLISDLYTYSNIYYFFITRVKPNDKVLCLLFFSPKND